MVQSRATIFAAVAAVILSAVTASGAGAVAALDGPPAAAAHTWGGYCVAGGYYTDGADHGQAFVAAQRHGVWGMPMQVPALAALNMGDEAQITSVSCTAAGNCAAGGTYTNKHAHQQAFVVSERRGVWGKAILIPGLAVLNTGRAAQITSVSCGSAGDCAAVEFYSHPSRRRAFVASERGGEWRKAIPVPGLAALNSNGGAIATSVSCASAGNCTAGGWYKYGARASHWQPFVVRETNGAWRKVMTVPGAVILNAGGRGQLASVSCSSAGNCSAGGSYTDASGHLQAFIVVERSGAWGKARQVRGLAALNLGNASVTSVSCAPAGTCAAAGNFSNASGQQAFVVSRS